MHECASARRSTAAWCDPLKESSDRDRPTERVTVELGGLRPHDSGAQSAM
jgi:hypothetical protein